MSAIPVRSEASHTIYGILSVLVLLCSHMKAERVIERQQVEALGSIVTTR